MEKTGRLGNTTTPAKTPSKLLYTNAFECNRSLLAHLLLKDRPIAIPAPDVNVVALGTFDKLDFRSSPASLLPNSTRFSRIPFAHQMFGVIYE